MRKVFIVIERRADYSRYRPILELLRGDPLFQIHLVVTGICLLEEHGYDVQYIQDDGFQIAARIPMFRAGVPDTGAEMVRATSRFLNAVVDELERAQPDIVLSGFDIGANFAVTAAAAHMNIPVAHIQGGEVTGSIDESLRHATSKFAHIHFPATQQAAQRLIRMGERPENVYVVGCPSLDVLVQTPYLGREYLEEKFHLNLSKPFILMIQHPVTTELRDSGRQIRETLTAIKRLGYQTIVMLPNNDAGYLEIMKEVRGSGIRFIPSLPTLEFVNLFRSAGVLVGNSSAGIHETATLKIPTVNIGTRQQGRERPANVIDVGYNTDQIEHAIRKALFDETFRCVLSALTNPYGDGHAAERIVKVLRHIELKNIIQKRFFDER